MKFGMLVVGLEENAVSSDKLAQGKKCGHSNDHSVASEETYFH